MIEHEILHYFPNQIAIYIQNALVGVQQKLEEIRIRVNNPILLEFTNQEIIINYLVKKEEMVEIMQCLCEKSIYSYQNEICNGYITLPKGHRVGITGEVVIKDGKVSNINYISSINFRIARQILGVSNPFLKYIIDIKNNTIYNTLIVSPPGAGKTTLLRDIVRNISNGISQTTFKGLTIGVVDERGEIAAMYKGEIQNDLGIRTDVLNNIPKSIGMSMLIRSMSPKIIVADEIGTKEDVESILQATCCGIKGIFTAHGKEVQDLISNPQLKILIERYIFERIIFLSTQTKGIPEIVYKRNIEEKRYEIID